MDLPSSMVTFVFIDTEGSTALLDRLGDAVAATARVLQEVALQFPVEHLSHCVKGAIESGGPEADKVAEASAAAARLVRF